MAQLAETDLISLMLAISSDEKKNARLLEIQSALDAVNAADAKAAQMVAEASQARIDATRIKAEAEAIRQNLAGKEAGLLDFEKRLGEVNAAVISEKAAWEKIRQEVEAANQAEAKRLVAWEYELIQRQDAVMTREVGAGAREGAANKRMDEAEAKIAALRAALDAVAPPPEPVTAATEDAA